MEIEVCGDGEQVHRRERPKVLSKCSPASQKFRINSNSPVDFVVPDTPTSDTMDYRKAKENVSVTVRFRPLSAREFQRGDEVAWYADGDTLVRSEYNPSTAYAFGKFVHLGYQILEIDRCGK